MVLSAWAKSKFDPKLEIRGVSVIGGKEPVQWEWNKEVLIITSPSVSPKIAIVYTKNDSK